MSNAVIRQQAPVNAANDLALPAPTQLNLVHETPDSFYHDILNDPLFHTPADIGRPDDKEYRYPDDELGWDGYPERPGAESWYEREEDEEEAGSRRHSKTALRGQKRKPSFLLAQNYSMSTKLNENVEAKQWLVGQEGVYRPTGATVPVLPPGVYMARYDTGGPYLQAYTILTDDLVALPDGPGSKVYTVIKKFWDSKPLYQEHGVLFRRGVLMYGPPGTGKTASLNLVAGDLIARGGIVVFNDTSIDLMIRLLHSIRDTEPERPLITVLEDIDAMINSYNESDFLALLDGEKKINNLVVIATTNHIEKLGARITNRPSRFDTRIKVDMPTAADRAFYLKHVTRGKLDDATMQRWARDTEGMSVAHLKEMAVAVLILGRDYAEVLTDLKAMYRRPDDDQDGFWQ